MELGYVLGWTVGIIC